MISLAFDLYSRGVLTIAGSLIFVFLIVWYLCRLTTSFDDKSTGPRSTGLSGQ